MTTKINLRISSELRDQLDELADENEMSTSEITRFILEEYFKDDCNSENEECDNSESESLESFYQEKYLELIDKEFEELDFSWSNEFRQLICWIYDHKSVSFKVHSVEQYAKFQKTIIKILGDNKFSNDLKKEFNKVLVDLILIENNENFKYSKLNFADIYNFQGFKYDKLNEFVFKEIRTINI